jgi:hypothetical protein
MVEQRSTSTEDTDASRMEYLLGVLRSLSRQDPPPVHGDRLRLLSYQRLRDRVQPVRRLGSPRTGLRSWLRPASVAALLSVIGCLTVVVHRSERLRAGIQSRVAPLKQASSIGTAPPSAVRSEEVKPLGKDRSLLRLAPGATARQMMVRLPYSNSAIDNGTDATIRVSMSQTELVSLGFPMNATLQDRRVVAEITLGDDGLPRSISVPLPLELAKEKK